MILKNCSSCIVYEPDSASEILLRARVRCMEDKITLHFEDESGLSEHTDRLRIDFCNSQVGYVKTFSELEVRKNTDPYILEPWIADCKILEMIEILQRQTSGKDGQRIHLYFRESWTLHRYYPEYQRGRRLSYYQHKAGRRRTL